MGVFFIISNSKGSTVKFVWQKSIKHIPKIAFQVIQQFRVDRVFKNSRKSNMIINCFALIHSPTPLRRSSVEKRCFNHSTRKWLVNMLIFTTVQGAWRRLVLYVRVSRRNHCAMMTKMCEMVGFYSGLMMTHSWNVCFISSRLCLIQC